MCKSFHPRKKKKKKVDRYMVKCENYGIKFKYFPNKNELCLRYVLLAESEGSNERQWMK